MPPQHNPVGRVLDPRRRTLGGRRLPGSDRGGELGQRVQEFEGARELTAGEAHRLADLLDRQGHHLLSRRRERPPREGRGGEARVEILSGERALGGGGPENEWVHAPTAYVWRRHAACHPPRSGRLLSPPPGRLLRAVAQPEELATAFGLLAELQPVRWTDEGLVLWPEACGDPERARDLIAACPVPLEACDEPGLAWPDPPSGAAGRIVWRSPAHAPAPAAYLDIVQAPGGAFGTGDHPTTRMCLEQIDAFPDGIGALPDRAALDAGCGSGILAAAWAGLGKGRVLAVDPDPEAARQARGTVSLSGLEDLVEVRAARVGALAPTDVEGAVILANLPLAGHLEILGQLTAAPPAALLSGLRVGEGEAVTDAYGRLGLRPAATVRRGGWECLRLEVPA